MKGHFLAILLILAADFHFHRSRKLVSRFMAFLAPPSFLLLQLGILAASHLLAPFHQTTQAGPLLDLVESLTAIASSCHFLSAVLTGLISPLFTEIVTHLAFLGLPLDYTDLLGWTRQM